MKYISFGDREVILNVLKNYQQLKDSNNLDLIEMVVIIDDLIDKCDFKDKHLEIINLIKLGYGHDEIYDKISLNKSNYFGKIEKIICKITEMNDFLYFHIKK